MSYEDYKHGAGPSKKLAAKNTEFLRKVLTACEVPCELFHDEEGTIFVRLWDNSDITYDRWGFCCESAGFRLDQTTLYKTLCLIGKRYQNYSKKHPANT